MAPEVGFEPTTNRLTADRSTTELLRITGGRTTYIASTLIQAKKSRAFSRTPYGMWDFIALDTSFKETKPGTRPRSRFPLRQKMGSAMVYR